MGSGPALGVMIRCVVTLKSALIIASWTLIQRNMIQVAGSRYVASVSNLKYPDTDMCVRIRRTWYTYVCNDMMYQIHQAGAHYDISDTEKRCIRYRVKTCIKRFTDVPWFFPTTIASPDEESHDGTTPQRAYINILGEEASRHQQDCGFITLTLMRKTLQDDYEAFQSKEFYTIVLS